MNHNFDVSKCDKVIKLLDGSSVVFCAKLSKERMAA